MTMLTARRSRRKVLIFVTAVLSIVSVVLLVVAVSTSSWVVGTATADGGGGKKDVVDVSYGLFSGTMEVVQATSANKIVEDLRGRSNLTIQL